MDTIYALSSGAGRAAVAVVRLSGPQAAAVLQKLAGRVPEPRRAMLATLADEQVGPIDRGLVLWFPGPASFTGEDSAEFHLHGSRAVVAALQSALRRLGCRPAEAGEFTRRAFLNGKLDLTETEGLADLIDAETEAQRRQALRLVRRGLGEAVDHWRTELLGLLALVEAEIDFVDEEDAPDHVLPEVRERARLLALSFADELSRAERGRKVREGYTVVIAGPPNAGKSTLLNALAGRDVAIVSDTPGTTRDAIELHLDLGGLPVILVDTAGLRRTDDPLEMEGIRRARKRAADADLLLWLQPADQVPVAPDTELTTAPVLTLVTKADLAPPRPGRLSVSVRIGAGLEELLACLADKATDRLGGEEAPLLVRERHVAAIERAVEALQLIASEPLPPVEIVAENLRLAARHLDMLIGKLGVEDVLDQIFSRFCIGK